MICFLNMEKEDMNYRKLFKHESCNSWSVARSLSASGRGNGRSNQGRLGLRPDPHNWCVPGLGMNGNKLMQTVQIFMMSYDVYAYGRKTVRAFCFFFAYCSLSWGWGGVGWGGMLTFLVLRALYIAMLLRSLATLHVATLLRSLVWVGVGVGWGGGHVNVPCTSCIIYCHVAKIAGIVCYVTCCYAAEILGTFVLRDMLVRCWDLCGIWLNNLCLAICRQRQGRTKMSCYMLAVALWVP